MDVRGHIRFRDLALWTLVDGRSRRKRRYGSEGLGFESLRARIGPLTCWFRRLLLFGTLAQGFYTI
jgi:hypothetical protein